MVGGSTSHEIFCPDLVLQVSGTFTRRLGVVHSDDNFTSFLRGFFDDNGETVLFLFFRGEMFGLGCFTDGMFLGEAALSEMT